MQAQDFVLISGLCERQDFIISIVTLFLVFKKLYAFELFITYINSLFHSGYILLTEDFSKHHMKSYMSTSHSLFFCSLNIYHSIVPMKTFCAIASQVEKNGDSSTCYHTLKSIHKLFHHCTLFKSPVVIV